jgi:hypothetical protein
MKVEATYSVYNFKSYELRDEGYILLQSRKLCRTGWPRASSMYFVHTTPSMSNRTPDTYMRDYIMRHCCSQSSCAKTVEGFCLFLRVTSLCSLICATFSLALYANAAKICETRRPPIRAMSPCFPGARSRELANKYSLVEEHRYLAPSRSGC